MAVFAPTMNVVQESTYAQMSRLATQVAKIHQSQKLGGDIENVIQERIACYSRSPFERGDRCLVPYITALVDLGRERIQSAPDLGSFLNVIRRCPIMYAVCMGDGNLQNCVDVEARCIDGMYDEHWRGRPFSR